MIQKALGVVLLAGSCAVGLACSPGNEAPECRRVEELALTPENHFAGFVSLAGRESIDEAPESVTLAMSLVRPVRGTIDLVHVVGDRELERWQLVVPASGGISATCNIGLTAAFSTCRAVIGDLPHPTGGYYYLQPNGNTVLEAGLSFYLCD